MGIALRPSVRTSVYLAFVVAVVISAWLSVRWSVTIEADAAAIERVAAPDAEDLVAARTELRHLVAASRTPSIARADLDSFESRLDTKLAGTFESRADEYAIRHAIMRARAALTEALNANAAGSRRVDEAADRLDAAIAHAVDERLTNARDYAHQIDEARRRAHRETLGWNAAALAFACVLGFLHREPRRAA